MPQASYGQGQVVVSPFQMVRVASAIASGCEAPVRYTDLPMTPYDKDTAYRFVDQASGFILFVQQSR